MFHYMKKIYLQDKTYANLNQVNGREKVFNPKHLKLKENGEVFSKDDYRLMFKQQCGRCDICEVSTVRLVADHDHTTGLVRSLLCYKCNVGLGFFDDSILTILKAAKYLRRFRMYKNT